MSSPQCDEKEVNLEKAKDNQEAKDENGVDNSDEEYSNGEYLSCPPLKYSPCFVGYSPGSALPSHVNDTPHHSSHLPPSSPTYDPTMTQLMPNKYDSPMYGEHSCPERSSRGYGMIDSPMWIGSPDEAKDYSSINGDVDDAGQQLNKTTESNQTENSEKRKPHRRKRAKRRTKKYKPYHRLDSEEMDAVDLKEQGRAMQLRREMFERGRPVAPWNTTQYIMSGHSPDGIDLKTTNNLIYQSSDSPAYIVNDSSLHKDCQYFHQDFEKHYNDCHDSRLENMTRIEVLREYESLVAQHKELEETLDCLRKKNQEAMKKHGITDIEAALEHERKEHERLLREKAQREGPTGDIVLPWDDEYHVSDDEEVYNESAFSTSTQQSEKH